MSGLKRQKATKFTKKQRQQFFLSELIRCMYNISKACESAGIHRSVYYKWLKEESFKEKYDEITEKANDEIEEAIFKQSKKGDRELLKFWAKTKMRHRGFIEKTEIEHTGNIQITQEDLDKAKERINKIINGNND